VAEGYGFRLRPVGVDDASYVVELRSDLERAKYLHRISSDVRDEERWLGAYLDRAGDYYFIVERTRDLRPEGTVGLYDVNELVGSMEWGRWVLRRGSLAAAASALHIYRIAFEVLGANRVYCRTLAANTPVLSFHDTCGLARTGVISGVLELNGRQVDAIEHLVVRDGWPALRNFLTGRAEAAAKLAER